MLNHTNHTMRNQGIFPTSLRTINAMHSWHTSVSESSVFGTSRVLVIRTVE